MVFPFILVSVQFLPFPELMPFRLTPQISHLLLPHSESGQLRSCMVHTLRALRNSPELLLNTMDVFVKEPSLDWKVCTWEFRKKLWWEVGDWGTGGRYFCLFVCSFFFICLYHITNLTGGELRDYSLMQDAWIVLHSHLQGSKPRYRNWVRKPVS